MHARAHILTQIVQHIQRPTQGVIKSFQLLPNYNLQQYIASSAEAQHIVTTVN